MITCEEYMKPIIPFIDKPFIKVINGIRRCGKSVVMRLLENELLQRGVEPEHIIYMNFESFEWIDIDDAKKLYTHIHSQIQGKDKYYLISASIFNKVL